MVVTIEQELKQNERIVHSVIGDLEFIPDHVDREDVFQVGMVALWEALLSWSSDTQVAQSTYCFRQVKFKILDYLKGQMANKRKPIPLKNEKTFDEGIEDSIMENQLITEMKKYLSEKDVEMFVDKVVNNFQLDELSEKYGIPIHTVKYRLKKIKQTLEKKLKWGEGN